MRLTALSLVLPLVAAMPANPTPRDLTESELLEKRNTNEGVYLSNCWASNYHHPKLNSYPRVWRTNPCG